MTTRYLARIFSILVLCSMIVCFGCVGYYEDDPYDPYDPYTPTPNPQPYPQPYPNPNPYPPDPYYPPQPYPNPNPYPPDPHYPHHGGNGRIEILSQDVGGGNMFHPKAKISFRVYGRKAQSVSLYAIENNGVANQIDSASCGNGETAYLNGKYNRGNTQYLEIRLYNNYGSMIARETLSSK